MNKKYLLLVALAVLFNFTANAQISNPVSWSTEVDKVSDTEYDLVIKAQIQPGWHLYSQTVDGGPIPTTFTFTENNSYKLIGTPTEEEGHTSVEPVFGNIEIKYFEDFTIFKQRILTSGTDLQSITGEVEYMACNDTQCTPPTFADLAFTIDLKQDEQASSGIIGENDVKSKSINNSGSSGKGLWAIFFIAFLSGFAALLTPCVFPMIPLTVSFFTKQSKSKTVGIRNAIIYGVSIVVIYVLLGVLVSAVFGADALNALSTNVWFNIIFFLLLIVFAVSFLGAFDLTLPNSWANKVDQRANKGGLIGIFFMALALAIVSFSCTGPIVGTLLVEAASGGNQIGPVMGMLGFSLAIALPFAFFAAFPGWLNSLPKSGGWLNTVKVVLGFLELALAFKFLSNADLVLQLHWLEREVFLAIWISIFAALTLYLFGKIKLPHDSPLTHISVGRLSLGLLSLTFTLYMIPGLWGAPLNLISAFPPPQHYSESPYGVGFSRTVTLESRLENTDGDLPEGAHLMPPHNILAFNDYDLGLAYAKKIGKPVMLDFTGHACVNCRKMEQNVWVKDKVLNTLMNDVVLISLYVDERLKFEEGQAPKSQINPEKELRYTGQRWSELQQLRYGTNAQPYYVLMDHNENNLNLPVGYTPDVDEFYNWLQEGISAF